MNAWLLLAAGLGFALAHALPLLAADAPPAAPPVIPVPLQLEAMKAVHPRLYLRKEGFDDLRAKLKDEPYRTMFAKVRAVADRAVASGPPAYRERDSYSGDEQLWQREVGNTLPPLALMFRLTGERKYLDAASAWMRASAEYPTWGLGRIDGRDLAAGHQLFGLAVAYDWLYTNLDTATRQTVERCLERRGQFMFDELQARRAWWHRSYLQNHQWVNLTGLAAAGLALYGHVPGVEAWPEAALEKFRIVLGSLGPDGASHEGVPYWTYGVEYLLKFMVLSRDLLGTDLFKDSAWFRQTASFRIYSMLPRRAWRKDSDLLTFADGPRYDWYGPEYLLRKLAAEYRDGHAQWLADELDHAGFTSAEASWLNLLWYDPKVTPTPPAPAVNLPTFKHFEDMGLVYLRSGWDGDEALCAFKCGPALGHEALRRFDYDPGAGHVHPDAASLQLFAHGDWLLVNDGYTRKRTAYCNTLVVNSLGQTGEGGAWFDPARLLKEKRGPRILRADAGKDWDYVAGDVTAAYEPEATLTRFIRHLVYVKPDCWVILDELAAKLPSDFVLSFHADFPFEAAGRRAFALHGKQGALHVSTLLPDDVVGAATKQPVEDTSGKPTRQMDVLTLSTATRHEATLFVTVLVAHAADGKPAVEPSLEQTPAGKVIVLKTRERTWRLTIDAGRKDVGQAIVKVE